MKTSIKWLIAALGLSLSAIAYANYKCQLDSQPLNFTGKTRSEYGKLLKEYKCAAGHTYWIAD